MPQRAMIIGAHPDDCEIRCGGTAALWRRSGWDVAYVSVTNGEAGHHATTGAELVARREAEAKASAAVIGAMTYCLGLPDGRLEPTLEAREALIRLIRGYQPDLIVTHRPNDYHPDHRYTSQLVQDASFLLAVLHVAADSPAMRRTPATFYCWDGFQKPAPFEADVAVDIGEVIDLKARQLFEHASQLFEWLPWLAGTLEQVPQDPYGRMAWVRRWLADRHATSVTDAYRPQLIKRYGTERGRAVRFAEAFERCEYGSPATAEQIERWFAFDGR